MNGEQIGVAISTTGHEHRMAFVEQSVAHWTAELPVGAHVFVTVDGTENEAKVVADRVHSVSPDVTVLRVGQPLTGKSATTEWPGADFGVRSGRLGVAANKNTGIEALMNAGSEQFGYPTVEHLFLSDDDTWPIFAAGGPQLHIDLFNWASITHSVVAWGRHRLKSYMQVARAATWTWPRGCMMYVHRTAITGIGGMDEAFGPGGHEHVEWSQRVEKLGINPAAYVSPIEYAGIGATGANRYWNAEDMRKEGETASVTQRRREKITSIKHTEADWARIGEVMSRRQKAGTAFVPFRAQDNGREQATMIRNPTSRGAVHE